MNALRSAACLLTTALAAFVLLHPAAAQAFPITYHQGLEVRADAVSVVFKPGTPVPVMAACTESVYGEIARISNGSGMRFSSVQWSRELEIDIEARYAAVRARVMLDGTPLDHALEVLAADPNVEQAYPIYPRYMLYEPDDPYFSQQQSNLRQIYVPQAWEQSDGVGVLAAVIDTGYRKQSDGQRVVMPGYDFGDNDNNTQDQNGHGTHISNTIVEATDNGIGAAGIAYEALLLPLKVFPDEDDTASSDDITDAIDYAVEAGADVINMSLGGQGQDPGTMDAVSRAHSKNVVLVAAAGNDADSHLLYPAGYDETIAVGSVTRHDPGDEGRRSDFSNYGQGLDLMAPGEEILQEAWSRNDGEGYYLASGTSSATPHVSAVAALMISSVGRVDAEEIRSTLQQTAVDMGDAGWDLETGYGELNAVGAVDVYDPSSGPEKPVAIIDFEIEEMVDTQYLYLDSSASYDPDGTIKNILWVEGDDFTSDQSEISFEIEYRTNVALIVWDDEGRAGTVWASIDPEEDTEGRIIGSEDDSAFCGLQDLPGAGVALVMLLLLIPIPAIQNRSRSRRCS